MQRQRATSTGAATIRAPSADTVSVFSLATEWSSWTDLVIKLKWNISAFSLPVPPDDPCPGIKQRSFFDYCGQSNGIWMIRLLRGIYKFKKLLKNWYYLMEIATSGVASLLSSRVEAKIWRPLLTTGGTILASQPRQKGYNRVENFAFRCPYPSGALGIHPSTVPTPIYANGCQLYQLLNGWK